jgi:NAD(P)-dependent dehydrogenase (short-subunit alcohol dehydrogenase family)
MQDWSVVVAGTSSPLGAGIARGLVGRGIAVTGHPGLFSGREEAAGVFSAAASAGPVKMGVHAAFPPEGLDPVPFVDLDERSWDAIWEASMRSTIAFLQAALPHLRGGGAAWVVVPTVAMSGAARFVATATAAEGQRLLVRSAARQWGSEGVRVNCVAVAPELALGEAVHAEDLALAPPALGRAGDPADDLAPVLLALSGDAGRFVTGLTLSLDGGVWMAG